VALTGSGFLNQELVLKWGLSNLYNQQVVLAGRDVTSSIVSISEYPLFFRASINVSANDRQGPADVVITRTNLYGVVNQFVFNYSVSEADPLRLGGPQVDIGMFAICTRRSLARADFRTTRYPH